MGPETKPWLCGAQGCVWATESSAETSLLTTAFLLTFSSDLPQKARHNSEQASFLKAFLNSPMGSRSSLGFPQSPVLPALTHLTVYNCLFTCLSKNSISSLGPRFSLKFPHPGPDTTPSTQVFINQDDLVSLKLKNLLDQNNWSNGDSYLLPLST